MDEKDELLAVAQLALQRDREAGGGLWPKNEYEACTLLPVIVRPRTSITSASGLDAQADAAGDGAVDGVAATEVAHRVGVEGGSVRTQRRRPRQ